MMRKIPLLAMLLLAAAPGALASDLVLRNYNLDSLTYDYPILCTPTVPTTPGQCPGPGYSETRKITTTGASSTTVTTVSTNAAFDTLAEGDVLVASPDGADLATPALRWVSAKASSNSITVDSALDIATAGTPWRFWKLTPGTGAAGDGWFRMDSRPATIQVQIDQMSVTGGIDYALECGMSPPGVATPITSDAVATANIAAAGDPVTLVVSEPYDVCRVGLKVTTNDNLDTITNGANDSIDFSEGALVCAADVVAGTYTGAEMAAAVQVAMNAVGICAGPANPGNAYTVTFNEWTGKYTITSDAASTATFSLLWATGVNNATAADTILGFAADLAGATTYTGAAVTHDIGAEAEKITVTVSRR